MSVAYRDRIRQLARELGASDETLARYRLPLCREARRLVELGRDVEDRPALLTPRAAGAWQRLRAAALNEGIDLRLVSTFRSVDYQADLIRRKMQTGLELEDILRVNALPGYSEHHTGRAVDLCVPECPRLEEEFEVTSAFTWLNQHAGEWDWSLSYPRGDGRGIIYEPWHWLWQPKPQR